MGRNDNFVFCGGGSRFLSLSGLWILKDASSSTALSISALTVGFAMSAPDDVGDDVLDLGCVEGSICESRGSFCLAGKLCTDRAYNTYALMDVMIKAFIKRRTKAAVCEWGHKLLIFTFLDESDRDWVIRNQPWHFDGHLFIVKSLNGSEQPSGVSITRASFWTRVYDLPIMCHTQATLISIAKRIGDLEVYEPPDGLNLGYYLRFKVYTRPLNLNYADVYDLKFV
ncbi:hypothetical protein ACS0TY_000989 [Phlomoides rotata]